MSKSKHIYKKRRFLTEEEIKKIRMIYPDLTNDEIAKIIGCSKSTIENTAHKLKLRKSEEHLRQLAVNSKLSEHGIKSRFLKGHTPGNKGRKMSSEAYECCFPTMFKKGHQPHNTKYDGCETVRTEKTGRKYFWVRLGVGKWKMKHILLWEQAHGKVPPGYAVTFKDGNSMNCVLENLELITRGELVKRNSLHNYPEDVRELFYLKAQLRKELNKHQKNGSVRKTRKDEGAGL